MSDVGLYKDLLTARLKGAQYVMRGLDQHWVAPVATIDAPNGFGEEIWSLKQSESLLAWRLGGSEVISELFGFRGRSVKQRERKVNLQPIGSLSRYRASEAVKFGHFYISDGLLARVAEGLGLTGLSCRSLRPDLVMFEDDTLWRLLDDYRNRSSDPRFPPSRIEMEARALLVVEHLVREYHTGPRSSRKRGGLAAWQLKRACQAMEAEIDGDIGLDVLASITGCTPAHFSRAFKQSTGIPPFAWLQRRRIERAKELLADPRLSLAEIALSVGFAAQPQFTEAFRRVAGSTPGQWRREQLA